jgi:glutathione peroxidase
MIFPLLLFFKFFLFAPAPEDNVPKSIYDFKVDGLEGGTIDFSKFKGKKILIVNTASQCGYTPQYEGLEKIYTRYKDKLVIVGFPSNDFGEQEPGSNKEIASFCQKNYGVSFPMAAKIEVKGSNMAPIYQWLTNKDYNDYESSTVKWNFQKYLIDEHGDLIAIFYSKVTPESPEVTRMIEQAIKE